MESKSEEPNKIDKLVLRTSKVLKVILCIWPIVWVLAILVHKDGWMIIGGFFMGWAAVATVSFLPGLIALYAVIKGTKHHTIATQTAAVGIGLTLVMGAFYVF